MNFFPYKKKKKKKKPFIWKTLSSFNFSPSLINWIKLCYCSIESCVLNNGWASSYFTPERGVRQGRPLSPYIFILCAEVLANKIRENKDIKGITVRGNEIKISQYADDTTMILEGAKKSFTSTLLDGSKKSFTSTLLAFR